MRVLKFGGTSVGDPSRIAHVCDIVAAALPYRPIVVVSAATRVTDMLLRAVAQAARGHVDIAPLAERLHALIQPFGIDPAVIDEQITKLQQTLYQVGQDGKATPEETDLVVSFGERISARTIAAILASKGIPAEAYDAFDIGMITDEQFGGAEPLSESESLLHEALSRDTGRVPVITGFIGRTRDGRITTLGRGGSDYTAAIVAAAVGADEIQIWTDVHGVTTADPHVVPDARTIPLLSFSEAAELAYFNPRIPHPKTILPAIRRGIPVRLLDILAPDRSVGTTITAEGAGTDPANPVRAIATKKNIAVVQLTSLRMLLAHGFLSKIFEVFARHRIVVDLVTTSEVSLSLTVHRPEQLPPALADLRAFADVQVIENKALVAVVGQGIFDVIGIPARVFGILADAGVKIEWISAGSGRVNISMVVPDTQADAAVRALHRQLLSTDNRT